MTNKRDFSKRVKICFKSNDIRCVYGNQLDEEIAYRTGRALVTLLKAKRIIVGRDMRSSSLSLAQSIIRGIADQGAEAIDIGMVDTPAVYFASGFFNLPGAMITASHNPAEYNGTKMVRAGALPIGENSGLLRIRELVLNNSFPQRKKGHILKKDVIVHYKKHVLSFITAPHLTKMKIVVDAGNGMAGVVIPKMFDGLPMRVIPREFKITGDFPHHVANPIKHKNIHDLHVAVKAKKADLGIAFDSDMDRVVFVDERGRTVDPSHIAALIIKKLCAHKKGVVVYNSVMSRIVQDTIAHCGGVGFKEKVGHAHIKSRMKKEHADFGCEHSAHYYFRRNYFADSALISALIVLDIFSAYKSQGIPFSQLVEEFKKYHKMEEKSVKVSDKSGVINKVESRYMALLPRVEHFDGLTCSFPTYWFNIRPSNTEPLLRVNMEATDPTVLRQESKKLLSFINTQK